MAFKFLLKQSPETKPPQCYKDSLLNWLLVIVINVVIGEFSWEHLKRLAHVTPNYRCPITANCLITLSDYNLTDLLEHNTAILSTIHIWGNCDS